MQALVLEKKGVLALRDIDRFASHREYSDEWLLRVLQTAESRVGPHKAGVDPSASGAIMVENHQFSRPLDRQ